ncbi:hypothetical protein EBR43_02675 [bacterium]|nr:hypothetical protein [bacterium]NBX72180.1 hypothetical protein [bacterium]
MSILSLNDIIRRSELKHILREHLRSEGLIEIDVPCLAKNACPDIAVSPIPVHVDQQTCFLQPSPEILLKRVLAQHPIDCYTMGPVFREDPAGPIHNPEFLMLEFYLIGRRYADLKEKTLAICKLLLGDRSIEIYSYQDIWAHITGVPYSPDFDYFARLLKNQRVDYREDWDCRTLEDLAFSMICQPHLGINVFTIIDGFPPAQAGLARIDRGIACRFELFIDGLELANGYDELIAPEQNKYRFEAWNLERQQQGLINWSLDMHFIDALRYLPECSGVAIGLERLLMLALKKQSLEQSMIFSWNTL